MCLSQASLTWSRGLRPAKRGSFITQNSWGNKIEHMFLWPSELTWGFKIGGLTSSTLSSASGTCSSGTASSLFGGCGSSKGAGGLSSSGSGSGGKLFLFSFSSSPKSDSQSLAIQPPSKIVSFRSWSDAGVASFSQVLITSWLGKWERDHYRQWPITGKQVKKRWSSRCDSWDGQAWITPDFAKSPPTKKH